MSQYIHFTEEQKEQAASVDLESFLLHRGEKLIASGREKRLASNHSITVRGNEWYDHAVCQGGHAISFAQYHYGLNYQDAILLLLGDGVRTVYPRASERKPEPPKTFVMPEAHTDMRRVFAYLVKNRQLDREVVSHFARVKLLFEDAQYHNAVFVGMDENGIPRHAHKRSTNSYGKAFRINIEGSDPRYSFHHIGDNGSLFVFEAPIDMLSYISMNPDQWEKSSYVACCGTTAQPVLSLVERIPQLQRIYLCMDNDQAGDLASRRMAELLHEKGILTERLSPELKDWNDDLIAEHNNSLEVNTSCSTFGQTLLAQ
ncbi:MAG: DUF3991 and toprim domain-containing protein [Faecousia sp.]